MENYDVAVVRCKTYDVEAVKPALEEALNAVNGLDFVKPGMKIIIKPNLVSFKKPDAAATTHPALLEALVEMLLARGADVTIGDSPGGPHSLPLLNRVYAATGMDRLEKLLTHVDSHATHAVAGRDHCVNELCLAGRLERVLYLLVEVLDEQRHEHDVIRLEELQVVSDVAEAEGSRKGSSGERRRDYPVYR